MPNSVVPTDPQYESDQGRIALWLDKEDLLWLVSHLNELDSKDQELREQLGRIRFRIHAALHKAGAKNDDQ